MKVTKEMYDKCNAQCANGFKLDIQYALFHGEKQVEKGIMLNDETKVSCEISTSKAAKNWKGEIVSPVETVVILSLYHSRGNGFWSSTGGLGFKDGFNSSECCFYVERIQHPEAKTAQFKFSAAETKKWDETAILDKFEQWQQLHGRKAAV